MEIKFLKDRKSKWIVLTLALSIIIFLVIYGITYMFNKPVHNMNFINRHGQESVVKHDTRELIIVGKDENGEIQEKNRIKIELADINKVFADVYPSTSYDIVDFNDKSITLKEKDVQNFDPNTYYIGEKDGYIALFKSDEKGNLFIENESLDISSRKVDSLPVADRELVMNYELRSVERDEMHDILSELET